MSVNKAIILGNVGGDPEVRVLQGGAKVASIRVATTEKYKDRNGNVNEQTEWHSVVVWGKPADFVEQFVKKGSTVFVEGKITTRQWADQQGGKRYSTEIKCESIQLVGGRRQDQPDDDLPPELMRR